MLKSFSLCAVNPSPLFPSQSSFPNPNPCYHSPSTSIVSSLGLPYQIRKPFPCFALSGKSDPEPDRKPIANPHSEAKSRTSHRRSEVPQNKDDDHENTSRNFPTTIPRKPRRGRRSEAVAVEDYVRNSLEKTFASIREQNPEMFEAGKNIMKESAEDEITSDDTDGDNDDNSNKGVDNVGGGDRKELVVEEDSSDWPLDADVGWGIRASEYFEKHPIKNVVTEDGFEIDWEGEIDYGLVQEINCLEWESFAFHPSPLIVLVFERYNRATDNWKALMELEEATRVYWRTKDKLPPRADCEGRYQH
ncbi:thioredoxin-like fold domain-containing protein MRL7, chloroplastic isoform X2 [Malania oleifera]|uniref:thioredoxin-like fold domain-containing protein MRL7, chloroplastic isoform X2 n=1 Tax=Malania oleifera TaxID=397392 RepID=UPI0025AE55B6|nr:thioredoxin-like fold domain-containing protein MRL7, chloroplastic isoform X2 [Malania oleifera]